ncbi:hypothetical protein [Streptomyces sp. MNP-20]|uniref:hypothetical protein n=1 Tax=Streptomyces sp. MNP-20 TaxID=2721165 RepID=UPI0015566B82|nr:hypothetical protein [Streptomyces sp. MNP-20]
MTSDPTQTTSEPGSTAEREAELVWLADLIEAGGWRGLAPDWVPRATSAYTDATHADLSAVKDALEGLL